jgi:hypothetical protein
MYSWRNKSRLHREVKCGVPGTKPSLCREQKCLKKQMTTIKLRNKNIVSMKKSRL